MQRVRPAGREHADFHGVSAGVCRGPIPRVSLTVPCAEVLIGPVLLPNFAAAGIVNL